VLWVCGDEPFQFQHWCSGKLAVGGADDFKVFLGRRGLGKSAFCAAREHVLPDKEWVKATLLYKDGMGKERRLVCELRERC
jgi:Mg-chelatase subunit ChlI